MGVVLDTSVLIEAERGKLARSNLLRTSFPKESIYVSSISVSVLYLGAYLSKEKFKAKRITSVKTIIISLVVIVPGGISLANFWNSKTPYITGFV